MLFVFVLHTKLFSVFLWKNMQSGLCNKCKQEFQEIHLYLYNNVKSNWFSLRRMKICEKRTFSEIWMKCFILHMVHMGSVTA